ncbi:MAG: undecaprenyl-diphosphate phosphatase [Spirochaetaceae bacterium]|jgi:undecaprenyl-diphosphatase|nr:undecaprenyl-diphosphate phosphatase [Spirochaetaceae bacterium]
MSILQALVLGIVQGLTEFLPVSSSGHLALVQQWFGIKDPPLLFDTMLHVGTLGAVCFTFWSDIVALLRRPLQKLTGFLILSTVLTALFAFAFKTFRSPETGLPLLESMWNSSFFLGCAFLVTSLSLLIAERFACCANTARGEDAMTWRDAALIGMAQGVGVLPGISRSGITLSAALGCKLERGFAARFSFLLSIPAILGALILQIKDFDATSYSNVSWPAMLTGTLAAAFTGLVSVRVMLRIIRTRRLYLFVVWTAILGICLLAGTLLSPGADR